MDEKGGRERNGDKRAGKGLKEQRGLGRARRGREEVSKGNLEFGRSRRRTAMVTGIGGRESDEANSNAVKWTQGLPLCISSHKLNMIASKSRESEHEGVHWADMSFITAHSVSSPRSTIGLDSDQSKFSVLDHGSVEPQGARRLSSSSSSPTAPLPSPPFPPFACPSPLSTIVSFLSSLVGN